MNAHSIAHCEKRSANHFVLDQTHYPVESVCIRTKGNNMITADDLRQLRAGPVLKAGRLNDATIRGWIASYGLKLGDREGRIVGNPRYDLADCARVFALYQLTKVLRMDAGPAVWAVNAAWAHFTLIAEAELAAIDDPTLAPDCPRYILSLPASAMQTEINPIIVLWSSPEAIADRESNRGRWLEVTMDLREIVRGARDHLVNELGYSTAGLRHDFADAVEPRHDCAA